MMIGEEDAMSYVADIPCGAETVLASLYGKVREGGGARGLVFVESDSNGRYDRNSVAFNPFFLALLPW
jgi:hypothetical protein